jgi:hypothetical protein
MNIGQDIATVEGLASGRGWIKVALYAVGALLVIALLYFVLHRVLFYGRDVAKAHGAAVVAGETGNASAASGAEAVNTVTRTYEYHTQVDHIVKEGQANVDRQKSFEDADAAGAAALCGLHHDLCRSGPAAAP